MLIISAQKISTQHYTQKKKKKEHKKQKIGDGVGDKNITRKTNNNNFGDGDKLHLNL